MSVRTCGPEPLNKAIRVGGRRSPAFASRQARTKLKPLALRAPVFALHHHCQCKQGSRVYLSNDLYLLQDVLAHSVALGRGCSSTRGVRTIADTVIRPSSHLITITLGVRSLFSVSAPTEAAARARAASLASTKGLGRGA